MAVQQDSRRRPGSASTAFSRSTSAAGFAQAVGSTMAAGRRAVSRRAFVSSLLLALIGAGAAAPPLYAAADLQDLWCAFGLAGCVKPAATAAAAGLQPAGAQVQSAAHATEPQRSGAHGAGDAALKPLAPSALEGAPAGAADSDGVLPATAEAGTAAAGHPAAAAGAAEEAPTTDRQPMDAGASGTVLPNAAPEATAAAASEVTTVEAPTTAAAADAAAVAARAAAASTAAPGTVRAIPAWALALLGASVACAALVQLWHLLPHPGLLRRLPSEEAAPAAQQACGPGSPQALRASVPCVDVEGALAASTNSQGPGLPMVPPPTALVTATAPEGAWDNPPIRQAAPGPLQAGKASPRPASPRGPPPLDVEPSVASRDLSRVAWVPTDPQQAHRRLSEFHNPLFGSASSPAAGTPAAGGTAAADELSGSWRAKTSTLGAPAEGEAGGDDFRLLAAALPEPSAGEAWDPAGQQAAASAGASSTSSSSAAEPPPPGSPGKAVAKSWASRKLTAAKSVGPQELPPLVDGGQAEPTAPSASSTHAGPASEAGSSAPAARRASTAGGSPQPERSAGTTLVVHAVAGDAPLRGPGSAAATTHGFRLLTAQQFHVDVKLQRLLGVGAAGCVYEAEWEGRQVAVKLMHPSNSDAGAFAREVEVMTAAGSHPHIVGLLACCLEPPLAVVQELAVGGSLHDQLHGRRLRPCWGLLLQLAEDVASALAHCHAQRPPIAHCDLSARNVLLGVGGRALLTDFGLARRRRGDFLSGAGAAALGTVGYMSPEAMQGGEVTERTDAFSYGVLLWEMLTGQQAWAELESPLSVIFAVGVQRKRLPIPPGCPPPIARLLKECWRHNAPLRPSFPEILKRLRQLRSQDTFKLRGLLAPPAAAKPGAGSTGASRKAALPGGRQLVRIPPPVPAASGSARPHERQ